MSLQQWLDNSWIMRITPSSQAISDLLAVAERAIADASLAGISADGRFVHAYDAVRSLCEAALHAAGYRARKGALHHQRVIESLKFTLGDEWAEEVDFFDRCRRRRHEVTYVRAGVLQQQDADELLEAAKRLSADVRTWLREQHPDLL